MTGCRMDGISVVFSSGEEKNYLRATGWKVEVSRGNRYAGLLDLLVN